MDELVERVREALAAEYSGADDGRVRDVPDRRAIRWYTTIGLVDRPLGMRGRSALYGPRHLRQLVAIKRQQAAGRSLSEIQADLAWASDGALAELSRVPERLLEAHGPEPDNPVGGRQLRFWAQSPAPGVWTVNPDQPPRPAAAPAAGIATSLTDTAMTETAAGQTDPASSGTTMVIAHKPAARESAEHKPVTRESTP